MPQPTPANWLAILFLGLIWGGTFMVVEVALAGGYGPVTIACARVSLGAAAMLVLMAVLRRPFPSAAVVASVWPYLLGIGIFSSALPFFLFSWGQQYVPSAFAGLSTTAVPLFVLPLAHVFSDEPMSLRKSLGTVLGFVGAMVLIGPGLANIGQGAEPLGQVACLGAALCYAAGSIMTRRCPAIDPVTLGALTLAVGAACLIPAMLLVEGLPGWNGPLAGGAIVFLGLFPTALAALLRIAIIRSAGSLFMSLVSYQITLWTMFFGWLVLSETLPGRFYVALPLVLIGLAITQSDSLRRMFRHAPR
ncbi:EamA-like transporter family protein [Roseisalinus antarcticus]|uniref:EamA-like transporter family protein n=2 Tax=Roseisalinus antarcticus TaxID=254357 RepID=A0A1Y5TP18_9RHOB|nr:DMT family transporter [Roseisalinus antarcticus]SLN66611.1 EamA-like transporter family protein [Roseisalinus antarcticus]